jgi:hypothetical protein
VLIDEKTPLWQAFGGTGLLRVVWNLAASQKRRLRLLVIGERRVIGSTRFGYDATIVGDDRRIDDAGVQVGLHLFNAERVGWPDDELGIEEDAPLSAGESLVNDQPAPRSTLPR